MKALPVSLLCLSIGVVGFLAGRLSSGEDLPGLEKKDRRAEASSERRNGGRGDSGNPGQARRAEAEALSAKGGFTSAMKGALGHTLEGKRLDRWMALLSSMRPEDAPAIAALLDEEQRVGRAFPAETTAFWQAWADLDAKGAWAYIQTNAETRGGRGTEPLMKAWAFSDPQAAGEAYRNLGDSPLADSALSGLMHGLAESDPGSAVSFAATLPDGRQIDAAVHATGSVIYMLGNENAQGWFDGLPATSPIFNKEAARVVMESLSRSDPGSVEAFAMARLDQQWSTRPVSRISQPP